jgi:membrane protein DedA with SNARE-associated domain
LFFLGRRFGAKFLSYMTFGRPASQRRIERLKEFMCRHGHLAIFYARFLAGIRAIVYVTAGSLGVDFSRFLLYDTLGALISVPIVVTLGYVFGRQIQNVIGYVGGAERFIWVIAICVLLFIGSRFLLIRDHPKSK